MTGIKTWGNKDQIGNFELSRTDASLLRISKTRKSASCRICDNLIAVGCYVLGKGYQKICLNCAITFLKRFNTSLKNLNKQSLNTLQDLQQNAATYEKNNVFANINKK